jgi:sporulation protein YlmC with PRC-barrel domain
MMWRKTMLAKIITTGVVGSLLLATAAFAEPPTVSQSSLQGDWRASKIVGLNVYNDTNQNVGSISDLITDKSGNIKAAILSVGGFLGMGSRLIAVPFDKIKFVNEPVAYTGTASVPNTGGARPGPAGTTTGSAAPATRAAPNPWFPDHAVFNATKDDLTALPEFKYATD